jgi:predicted Zn finger-like uncharacterized protein
MILTCPNCGTQYAVKDGAIPDGGRQVRCAACKHSWHQAAEDSAEPEAQDQAAPELEAEPVPEQAGTQPDQPQPEGEQEPLRDDGDESFSEAALIEPRSGPAAEERAYEEAMLAGGAPEDPIGDAPRAGAFTPASVGNLQGVGAVGAAPPVTDWDAPPEPEAQEDDFSPFADQEDEEEPRRRSRIWPLVLLVLLIAALAAAFWFLAPPEWKARAGLTSDAASPLALVTTHMDRQRLESGNELLTVTGRVINPTAEPQSVPPLQAQLRSSTGAVVYSWTIAPPARNLPPGASASFNSAEVNVPPGGEELTISVGSPKA